MHMKKIYYNKLCRDKVPELIKGKGFECDVRVVEHDEFKREIIRKVAEESSGVVNQTDVKRLHKELADLYITLDAVKKEFGISEEEVSKAIQESLDKKGGYDERLYLSWSSDTEYSSHDHPGRVDD